MTQRRPKRNGDPAPRATGMDRPRVPRTFTMQDESSRLVEALFSPWPATRWRQNDFGVDAVIEITTPVERSRDREASGRWFAVQLKSSDDADEAAVVRVFTGHLTQWADHSLPVLLISAHLPSQRLRGRWIDERLLLELKDRSPGYWAQGTVTVPLPEVLDRASLRAIEGTVLRFAPRRRPLRPSTFFQLRERVLETAARLERIAEATGVQSAHEAASAAHVGMKASAYTVAIAGPPRVGKSTLVNALLGMDVSPVADYPTTAVPLLFESGERPRASVRFASGKAVEVAATSAALAPYAAQQENDGNTKDVRLVHVQLPNDALARGMSLVDSPGLRDASPSVREVTKSALHNSDAVVYVMDASLGAKFSIGQNVIEDLEELRLVKDRVLLLLNQADGLGADQRERLREYVDRQLDRYGLRDGKPVAPMFVSGKDAWEARARGEALPQPFLAFEDELWGHLLRTRATGLHRLHVAADRVREGCELAEALLADRVVKGGEAGELDVAKRTCQAALRNVRTVGESWHSRTTTEIHDFVQAQIAARRQALHDGLVALPASAALPGGHDLGVRLQSEVVADAEELWHYLDRQARALADAHTEIVQDGLRDSRAQLGIPMTAGIAVGPVPAPPLVNIAVPEAGVGLLLGLLGFIFGPEAGLISMLLGLLAGGTAGAARRRVKAIDQIVAAYRDAQTNAYTLLEAQARDRLRTSGESLVAQACGRLDTFVHDAERRLARLGAPLAAGDTERLRAAVAELRAVRAESEEIRRDLVAVLDRAEHTETT